MAWGWLSRAAIRPSRRARCRCCSASPGSVPTGGSLGFPAPPRPSSSSRAIHTVPMPPPPICDSRRYRPATSRPGRVSGAVTVPPSDGGRDPVAPCVLLLGAGGKGVVEGAQLLDRLGGEVVEELPPGRGLVVAAGQQQLPGLRLAVALAALGDELGQVGVLGGRLLRRGGPLRQRGRVATLEDADDRLDHVRSYLRVLAHVRL